MAVGFGFDNGDDTGIGLLGADRIFDDTVVIAQSAEVNFGTVRALFELTERGIELIDLFHRCTSFFRDKTKIALTHIIA